MTVNSISLAQNLLTTNNNTQSKTSNVSFRGGEAPDLEALKAKQDEFRRMSEQVGGQNSTLGKLGKLATKVIGVVIAFTAAKICLDKAANMIGGAVGKYADKAVEKATEKAAEKAVGKTAEEAAKIAESATKLAGKVAKAKSIGNTVQKYAVNIIAGGAAVGTAMQDFGLVKKQVATTSDNLVDNAIDNSSSYGYNSGEGSTSNGEYNVSDDEF